MKILKLLPAFILSLFVLQATAQTEAPKGFRTGKIVLPDNTVVTGFIKDNIRKDASVVLITDGKEKKFNGADIASAVVGETNYTCMKGDFFKVICTGKISFLQKASNAAGKTIYNGAEAIILSGTEGKIGDYFSYNSNQLTLINKKTVDTFIAEQLSTCTAAVEKAKTINGDIAALAAAVTIYNDTNK